MKDIFLKEIYIKVQYFKKAGGVFFLSSSSSSNDLRMTSKLENVELFLVHLLSWEGILKKVTLFILKSSQRESKVEEI